MTAMKRMTTVFREMLASPGIIHAPIAHDPLTARIAERVGFRCLDLGGYALGASSCVPEPLLSLEELMIATRRITAAVNIPLMVDGGAGLRRSNLRYSNNHGTGAQRRCRRPHRRPGLPEACSLPQRN